MSIERNPTRVGQVEWLQVEWSDTPVMTRGSWGGVPAFGWGWADPRVLATRRQLAARGLRPGGQDPVAVVLFGHTEPHRHRHWRRADHAWLYEVAKAKPKRRASPAQRVAIAKALTARRTCTGCGEMQEYYLSTLSRQCGPCAESSGFWDRYLEQRFGPNTPAPSPPRRLAAAGPTSSGWGVEAVGPARHAVEEVIETAGAPGVSR